MTDFTDEDLDRDWTPNGRRPQSTIAQSFSQELMDIFRIDNSITDLDSQVDRRKRAVTTRTSELEALEARLRHIRDIEERLRQKLTDASSPQGQHSLDNSVSPQGTDAQSSPPMSEAPSSSSPTGPNQGGSN